MAAAVLAAPQASAAPPNAAVAAAPHKSAPSGSDRVCWDEKPTGTHFPIHVCANRDELELRRRRDQDALNQKPRNESAGAFSAAH